MTPQARSSLEKFVNRKKVSPIDLDKICFDKQLAFIKDPNLFVTAVTSRRAGKSTACVLHLLHTAITYPKSTCFYITYARTDAKGIVWPLLHELNRDLKIGGEANEADLIFKFNNGSIIRLAGAATAGEIDRFRGYSIKLAYIDEAQRFGNYLDKLINDVLVPACFDVKGSIRLIGTPPPVPVGAFYDSYTSKGWSSHHWNMFDNPWIEKKRGETPQEVLRQELERRGVTESDPTIQREIFGKFVIDRARLVIEYSQDKNHFDSLPIDKYSYIMGIDLGYKDADAIVILAHTPNSPTTYIVDELITNKQGLTELFQQVEELRKQYDCYKIVIDTGGLGLKIAESMRQRYLIPVQAAEKTRKFENIELMNDSLRTKRLMAKKTSRFANDAMLLEWDMDKTKPDKKFVSDRFHSDIIDATLYAFRESPAYAYQTPTIKPKWGTPEWGKEEERVMEQMTIDKLKDQELLQEDQLQWL